jgi:hypothetical protein
MQHSEWIANAMVNIAFQALPALTAFLPYPPPRKAARRTRKSVAFMNMDNGPRWGAKNVQFFVVSRRRRTIAGLVFLLIGHSR